MARVFITGSSDGLGQLAAKQLVEMGHQVVLHARNETRAEYAISQVPGAEKVLIAELSDIEETKKLAKAVNDSGAFDAIIHNAGVYQASNKLILTVNTLAPYILTCLIEKPKRLIYLSSGMHMGGDTELRSLKSGQVSYSDSKFHVVLLSKAVARKWPDVYSNAVDPGWVPTKMGGPGAPDNLKKGYETQVWLAVHDDAKITSQYFFHQNRSRYLSEADNVKLQEQFLARCRQITGVQFPA